MKLSEKFIHDANNIAFDINHRNTIRYNMNKYQEAVKKGTANYQNKELARERAACLKRNVLKNWSTYLERFERNFIKNGGNVHWAVDTDEATSHLVTIMQKHKPAYVMKSKSMTTEEIHTNEVLEHLGIEVIETDLGEFIVQLAGEKPYHILTPAMHKSKEDVAALFHKHFKTPANATPEELTRFVRKRLREKFVNLEIGITGANFLVADTGSVCLTENEGNGLMTTAFSNVHIIIAGIEKIIPEFKDLGTFWPLVANAGTGQKMTVYNTIFNGIDNTEKDGPKEVHIILLDNGRTNLYATNTQFEALSCIRCGACLNNCPIYHNIGGYTYNSVYSGPIGSVITPHLKSHEYTHLSFACSLCGKCKDVCPVKIDLPEHILQNRRESNKTIFDNLVFNTLATTLNNRFKLDFGNGYIKNAITNILPLQPWGNKKDLPKFSDKSFSKLYCDKNY